MYAPSSVSFEFVIFAASGCPSAGVSELFTGGFGLAGKLIDVDIFSDDVNSLRSRSILSDLDSVISFWYLDFEFNFISSPSISLCADRIFVGDHIPAFWLFGFLALVVRRSL